MKRYYSRFPARTHWAVTVALAAYGFVVFFGDHAWLGIAGPAGDLSLLLALAVIALRFSDALNGIVRNRLFRAILFFFAWSAVVTLLFYTGSLVDGYVRLVTLVGYLFLAASVAYTPMTARDIGVILWAIGTGVFISSSLTLIDYSGLVNVPIVNDHIEGTWIQGERFGQASGFFSKRSSMAGYYALAVPTLVIYATSVVRGKASVLLLGTSLVGLLALLLTHNRSGVLAIGISLIVYAVFFRKQSFQRRVFTAIKLLVFGAIAGVLFVSFFPEHFSVYEHKLTAHLPGVETSDRFVETDLGRLEMFQFIIGDLARNPLGNGFGLPWIEPYGRYMSPHNVVAYIIWAGGVMAIGWLLYFTWLAARYFSTKRLVDTNVDVFVALKIGILAWLLHNMAHLMLSTGLAWVYFGLMISILMGQKARPKDVAQSGSERMAELPVSPSKSLPKA